MESATHTFAELSQVPLTASYTFGISSVSDGIWQNSLIFPAYGAGFSVLVLLASAVGDWSRARKLSATSGSETPDGSVDSSSSPIRRRIESIGGFAIVSYRIVQLLGILSLLGISIAQFMLDDEMSIVRRALSASRTVQAVQIVVYTYLSVLGFLQIFSLGPLSSRAYIHTSSLLFLLWSIYLYRNVWPLATVNLVPADKGEGLLLWAKITLLSLTGFVVPIVIPKKYIPVNPKEPFEPNPEQTASFLSFNTYTFIAPVIWRAYSMRHLPFDMLPPLPDYDHLKNIVGRSFPHLDPLISKSRRHVGLKLIRVFWLELLTLASMSVTAVIGQFAAPISINNLLTYFETGGEGETVRPWFWIALLFFGRIFQTICDQWFIFTMSRVDVRMQAIITELVFEHALRVRMKAGTSEGTGSSAANTAISTPDTVSQADDESRASNAGDGDTVVEQSATSSTTIAPASLTSSKGKGKAQPESETTKTGAEGPKAEKNIVGRINNLVSSDLSSLDKWSMHFVYSLVESPFQIVLCMIFLYQIMGWSTFVGVAIMLLSLPVPGFITARLQGTQREKMERTDSRVQTVTEMMNVIRMIKLFGWEPRIATQLNEKRELELVSVKKNRLYDLANDLCNYLIPILIMLATFSTYAIFMKGELTASKVFSAIAVFDMLRMNIQATFWDISFLVQANVSLERISDFLYNTELIDEFTESDKPEAAEILTASVPDEYKDTIGIRHASFTWAADSASVPITPGGTRRRTFALNIEDEVFFHHGKINLIVGPTGAGKTSLLMALLGEMHYIPQGPDSFVNLPRDGGVAYAAQESWVQNDTIKNNIVFGSQFDEVRYTKVLDQCALRRDLELFDAGDQTEVGEKGVTLSGGQKARITLARAVYSSAEIVLLDDILAALDVHTSRHIVEKCLKSDLIRGRTVILVTHNVAMVSPVADFIVDMGSDGRILSQGSLSSALSKDSNLLREVEEEQQVLEKTEQELDPSDETDKATGAEQGAGKLVVAEELKEGHVGWDAVKLFLANVSRRPLFFWIVYISGVAAKHLISNIQTWYLGVWAAQYEVHPPSEVAASHYLTVYTALVGFGTVFSAFCVFYYVFGSIRASRIIHEKLVVSVLGTTLRWLDKTPTARIITRCTEDIQALDNRFSRALEAFVEIMVYLILKMFGVIVFSPIFIFPALLVALGGVVCGNIYMKAQLCVKREMSAAKAPVLGHFGAAISGITSIRAYGVQEAFKAEAYRRIDRYSRVAITHNTLNRWVMFRVDTLGALFTASLGIYLTYFTRLSASNTGFSFAMAAAFNGVIMEAVRMFNETEISGNSLERIQQYLVIEQEPKPTPEGVPPAYWPASGKLEVDELSARYSEDGPKVLHNVSFTVASGERVGIVGRTGSGKSSLTLALLRCILTEGIVRYDGLSTNKLNLDALRSNITIIPQVPELLSGSLRQNLDPFSEHDDAVLNDALRSAGLFSVQDENDQSRITLDSQIAGGGANLSVGQRQILALARAIVRRSKLLILDEATSAIDYETDSIIQTSLRTELGKDVTLLTVAHRLQTIMDSDKIMVLDAGRIVEFGKPSELLKNEKGLLRALVDESGDKEKLYTMANAASASA
ncbi:P-loop containing nucleoside triphosphate hydrolase protein [Lentinus tigrinus ALCF2SS1-7]|uniref:P-loop containing nucleoside triphosphate hydrolase protein n=1 Tax=Lentinus tigrinus ALCF2SS1-6 TaxID=1328759 RepID=A0A5C2RWC7_9APHY|nr:P-loop containing nucleoside triphosphate hydrolase protein [Lentinus tigrinus ALCF2SS1-6]RPD70681.1 P-loop containing nucleoside triphosphate hydrolase protein [Lentinus tigrinus ALCF2SS1-7]